MKNKAENENKKFSIVELFKNKQYYAILNLSFYSLLIIALIVFVRVGSGNGTSQQDQNINGNTTTSEVIGFDYIKNKNFEFSYSLKIDSSDLLYQGKQFGNKILFTDITNNKDYYVNEDIYLVKQENQYILTESPLQYFNYLSVELIESILKATISDENELVISLGEFLTIIGNTTDYNSDDDIIINLVKQNNNIRKIEMDITSYIQLTRPEIENAFLVLDYSNFNLVEDIKIK